MTDRGRLSRDGAKDEGRSDSKPGYLFVIPWSLGAPGGVSRVVLNLALELERRGWRPTVLQNTWSAPRPQVDVTGPVPVIRWRIRPAWSPGRPVRAPLGLVSTFPSLVREWRRLARRYDWRVVNVHYPEPSTYTLLLLKRVGVLPALVVSVHGTDVRSLMDGGSRCQRALQRRVLEGADAVVACSSPLAEDVSRFAPESRGHLHTVNNGVAELTAHEPEYGDDGPATLGSRRFVLNVATFEHKKAQDVLVAAFAHLADRHPDVDLVLVGRSTPWTDTVRRHVRARGLEGRVHIRTDASHSAVLGWLARATVFCLPSRWEGHPLALLEAASFGLPAVATPVGDVPRTIPEDRYGLLVPVEDEGSLAEALQRVLEDPDLAMSMGQALRGRVAASFTWRQTADRYLALAERYGAPTRPPVQSPPDADS